MTRLNRRRAASAVAIVLYFGALFFARGPWFLAVALAIIALELWIQSATEIGWRFFRHNLDERQEELQNRILAISYRVVIAAALVMMVFLAGFGWYVGSPGGFRGPGEFAALVTRTLALIVVLLFLLPGHVSAWLEPAPDESRVESLGT